ncbi:MAG TPA: hypothetical protein VK742_09060 [Candidatus Sulfotelmatobacter sp.]|jgi:hypothetical protein|nr:hypothetical protein [Candidatus Sulfotelmatobacter sp.]
MTKRAYMWIPAMLFAAHLSAQTNMAPARLAIVGDSADAAPIVDVLTAEFSKDDRVQLLERADIEKVIREQQLSLNNLDGIKLGRLLGADGVLFLSPFVQEVTNKFLDARFVAVKPGVVLAAERFSNPEKDLTGWASHYVGHLGPYVAKLGVLARDAVPVSVVNFRSAVSASDAAGTERQLQTLAVERLSREPRLFVLERQKMQQLTGEKDLSADETAFWNGAWLLEGVIDQNGFSKDIITLNARLTPAKGGEPLQLEAGGSRTNFAEVINQLAAKVLAAVQISPTVKEFNAADEAAQFFSEAQWAFRWGEMKEAHAAAEAAWALGKQDEACATLRIRSLINGLKPPVVTERGSLQDNGLTNPAAGKTEWIARELRELAQKHPAVYIQTNKTTVFWLCFDGNIDPAALDDASLALETYYEFSRNAPQGLAGLIAPDADNRRNREWYQLGLDSLVAASRVLERFYLAPAVAEPESAKLVELRGLIRKVAGLLSDFPGEHERYYAGNRIALYDELADSIGERPNIFKCELAWGALWQERPEDCVALYRELLGSPVFCYIQRELWSRPLAFPSAIPGSDIYPPQIIAWDAEGRQRIPGIWKDFISELDGSTNLLWRLEAHALQLAQIQDEQKLGVAFTNFFEEIISNRAELVANPVDVMYGPNWDGDSLSSDHSGSDVYLEARDRLSRTYFSSYRPQLEDMEREYRNQTVPAAKATSVFEKQKKFLRDNEPFDFTAFIQLFQERSYNPVQAQEILTLIIAYKSNLLAQAVTADPGQKFGLQNDARNVEVFLQRDVEKIAHPSPPPIQSTAATQPPVQNVAAAPPVRAAVLLKPEPKPQDTVTNIISVDKFLELPLDGVSKNEITDVNLIGHRFMEGKLLLDIRVITQTAEYDNAGYLKSTSGALIPAIAILDVATEKWQVIACPELADAAQNGFFYHTTLWQGRIYTSDGNKVKKFDPLKNFWQELDLPDIGNCELFTVQDRLYAATHNLIVEILGDGSTRILASNRRQPPVSVLDTENLGTPALFAGPGGTLRAVLASKVYSWDETNWNFVCAAPSAPRTPELSDEAVLLFGDGWNTDAGIWRLPVGAGQVEYCLGQPQETGMVIGGPVRPKKPKPLWDVPKEFRLERLAAATHGTDLYLLTGRAKVEDIVNEQQHEIIGKRLLPQDGYHAELFCYSANYPAPQKVFLKFDATDTTVPVGDDADTHNVVPPYSPASWILASGNKLFVGWSGGMGEYQTKLGVWVASLEQIGDEVERQKKLQAGQLARKSDAKKSADKVLLDQFDWNHDGVIDGEEKEAALTNQDYIASQLDEIDLDQNGVLDASELKFFDANTNNILDPNEQSGIEITQRLLAERLVRKFDADGNGLLNWQEFDNLKQNTFDQRFQPMMENPFPDENHDGSMDVEEVKDFLESRTENEVERITGTHWVMGGIQTTTQRARRFKKDVENLWQDGSRRPRPFGPGSMPPFMQPPSPSQPRPQTNQ